MCPSFFECLGSSQRSNLVPAEQVKTDAQAGMLPSFALVTPTVADSQHNGNSMLQGDNWVGSIVSAIENGPEWLTTAVFITWDDCGCFYDHVPPPNKMWGIREPMLIVSPYAKPGFTDSTDATFVSLLAFTEHTFGLPPLNTSDGNAYDYSNAFSFSQGLLKPVAMVQTSIPEAERIYLAAHPADQNDVT